MFPLSNPEGSQAIASKAFRGPLQPPLVHPSRLEMDSSTGNAEQEQMGCRPPLQPQRSLSSRAYTNKPPKI